jgi:hypothetical protein
MAADSHYDVIIIETGASGGTLTYHRLMLDSANAAALSNGYGYLTMARRRRSAQINRRTYQESNFVGSVSAREMRVF